MFTGDSAASNPRLWSGHPGAVQIVVHQSVEKIPEHSVYEPKGRAFPQSAHAETLGFCDVFVDPLLENPKTDTTFLLRSPKTEKVRSLTN